MGKTTKKPIKKIPVKEESSDSSVESSDESSTSQSEEIKIIEEEYLGVAVFVVASDRYMNATDFCKKLAKREGTKKRYSHWLKSEEADEMLSSFGTFLGIPIEELTYTIGEDIYVHPSLSPHIMSWISPKFSLKMAKIVNQEIIKEQCAKTQHQLMQKDAKIDRLEKKLAEMEKNKAKKRL